MAVSWETRWAELVRRLTAGRESSNLEVLPDLMPVLPVADPSATEHLLARRERLYSATNVQLAGGAGTFAAIALENPPAAAGQGALIIIEEVCVFEATGNYAFEFYTTASGVNLSGKHLDTRGGLTGVFTGKSTGLFGIGLLGGAAGGAHWRNRFFAGEAPVRAPAVLAPGIHFRIVADTVNSNLGASIRWRERWVDPAELTPTGA